jgi:hypothetical protein
MMYWAKHFELTEVFIRQAAALASNVSGTRYCLCACACACVADVDDPYVSRRPSRCGLVTPAGSGTTHRPARGSASRLLLNVCQRSQEAV